MRHHCESFHGLRGEVMTTLTTDRVATRQTQRPIQMGKRDWAKAFQAFRRLRANKEDTYQVFEIMRALSGRSASDGYLRLLKTQEGGRIAFEHVEFAARLMDRAWVESFEPG